MNRNDFANVLFEKNDTIIVCAYKEDRGKETNVGDFASMPGQFFVINASRGGRKMENVTCYRNFLIEFDDVPIEEQMGIVKSLEMPYSTIVFSGGKSLHFIIALETPLPTKEKYDHFAAYLHNVVKKADPSTKPCCKLSRYPDIRRSETHKLQEIKEIRGRVSNQDFIAWLEKHPDCVPTYSKVAGAGSSGRESIIEVLDWYVLEYLRRSYDSGKTRTFVQCPICADEGCDTAEDNMCITHTTKFFHCFKNREHDKLHLKRMISLKRGLGMDSKEARDDWIRHNEEKKNASTHEKSIVSDPELEAILKDMRS